MEQRRLKKQFPLFLFLKEVLWKPWRAYYFLLCCCHCIMQCNDSTKWSFWISSKE